MVRRTSFKERFLIQQILLFGILLLISVSPQSHRAAADLTPAEFLQFYAPTLAEVPSDVEWHPGHPLTEVQMRFATVCYDITSFCSNISFFIKFSAQYVLYNPNATMSMEIAFPWRLWEHVPHENAKFIPLEAKNFIILVSNQSASVTPLPWNESRSWRFGGQPDFFLFEALLEGYKETIINISFDFSIILRKEPEYMMIDYIVGTARDWTGNITELVQFIAWDNYPDITTKDPTPTIAKDTRDGRKWGNYSWFFGNQRIDASLVGIGYNNPHHMTEGAQAFEMPLTLFSLIPLLFLKRRRNKLLEPG